MKPSPKTIPKIASLNLNITSNLNNGHSTITRLILRNTKRTHLLNQCSYQSYKQTASYLMQRNTTASLRTNVLEVDNFKSKLFLEEVRMVLGLLSSTDWSATQTISFILSNQRNTIGHSEDTTKSKWIHQRIGHLLQMKMLLSFNQMTKKYSNKKMQERLYITTKDTC